MWEYWYIIVPLVFFGLFLLVRVCARGAIKSYFEVKKEMEEKDG